MEQKKSQRADLERWRPALFLVGLVVSLSLFFAALGYRTSDDQDIDVSSLLDDVSKENEYVPAYVPDRTNMVAAAAAKPKKPDTQQLKVVDHKTPAEQLGDIAKSHTEGEDGDEAADAEKAENDTKATPQPIAVDMSDNPLNFRIVEQLPEFPVCSYNANSTMRVMRMMPRWKPGVANNRPCRTMMAIPVEFAL